MNHQEIFDKVAAHLLTQMVKSQNEAGHKCMYRGTANTRCAVGCLIPDDKYDPSMEKVGGIFKVSDIKSLRLDEVGIEANETNQRILGALQFLHDYTLPEDWANNLLEYCQTQGLDAKVLEQFKNNQGN